MIGMVLGLIRWFIAPVAARTPEEVKEGVRIEDLDGEILALLTQRARVSLIWVGLLQVMRKK
jgi:hypothetical protein